MSAPNPQQDTVIPQTLVTSPYQPRTSYEDIKADPDSNSDDSGTGGLSDSASLTSARSSVYNFVTKEDGRRYHAYRQGKYLLPNDEIEQDRLDLQHQLWLLTLHDQLSLAPLKDEPKHVLDLGTGTGIWATEYALQHPTTAVIGTDLSPIQPAFIPTNCSFEVEDFEDDWIYHQKFDLIHARLLVSCLPNPPHIFTQAFASLAPGGYLEMQDGEFPAQCTDGSLTGTALDKWYQGVCAGFAAAGRVTTIPRRYKEWMLEAGFVDVEDKVFFWPINAWCKDAHLKRVGIWFRRDLLELVETLTPSIMVKQGMSKEEVASFIEDVKRDVYDRHIHAYHIIRVVTGRKPE